MRTLLIINIFLNVLFLTTPVSAKEYGLKWSEIRIFLSETTFAHEDENFNALLQMDQIEKMTKATGFGLEVNAEITPWFKGGTKIKGIFAGTNKKDAPFPATEYLAIQQYSAGLTGRVLVINKEKFYFDIFGELGLSNNTIELQSSLGKAKWEKNSHFYQRGGASMGFGGSSFKMYVEGGYENFKLDNLKYEGTIGQNADSIDLSGSYIAVGLIFSGIPSWIKPGGLSVGN